MVFGVRELAKLAPAFGFPLLPQRQLAAALDDKPKTLMLDGFRRALGVKFCRPTGASKLAAG